MSETNDGSATEESSRIANNRLLVTHEGYLDPSLLVRTEGYMHKKGGAVNSRGGLRNWKKRWFVIAPIEFFDTQGYELQYYDSPGGNLKGKVGLSDIELFVETKSANKRVKYEFQILLQNGGVLELSCDTPTEREEWIETLNMIIAYLRKVLTSSSMTLDGYDPVYEDDETVYQLGDEIANNCQAFGPGLFGSEAGQMTQFVVQIHDLMGQQVTKGGMPITATISNAECLYYLRILDNEDGTYLAQYTMGSHGAYNLEIKLNDEHHIFGSPFHIDILPSKTVAKFCTAAGTALTSIKARSTDSFVITARDGFGNAKTRGGDPFEVGVMGPAILKSLTDNNNGTYTCEIEANSPGAVNYVASSSLLILVTLQGKAIAQSPFKPIILDDPYSPSKGGMFGSSGVMQSPYRPISSEDAESFTSGSGKQRDSSFSSSGAASQSVNSSVRQSSQQQQLSRGLSQTLPMSPSRSQALNAPSPPPQPTFSPTASLPSQSRPQSFSNTMPGSAGAGASGVRASKDVAELGSNLSRLERARMRALQAKSEGGGGGLSLNQNRTEGAHHQQQSPQYGQSQSGGFGSMQSIQQQQQQQQQHQQNANRSNVSLNATAPPPPPAPLSTSVNLVGSGNSSRLAQLAARNATNLSVLKKTAAAGGGGYEVKSNDNNNGNNNLNMSSSLSSHTQSARNIATSANVDVSSVLSGLRMGLGNGVTVAPPVNATPEEQSIWDITHKACSSNHEVLTLLNGHLNTLKAVFDVFSDYVEGVQVIKLVTSGNTGMYKLLESYEVVPSFVTKIEVKVLFSLIAHSQRNLKSPASVAGGGTGLDFISFLKLLVMTACHAMGKTAVFTNMYPTSDSRVEVMLFKWGLADTLKLQIIGKSLLSTSTGSASAGGLTRGR